MLFKYKAIDDKGADREGEIDTTNRDAAVSALQRRGLVVVSIVEVEENKSFLHLSFFESVSNKDIVVFSRQISTLFEAQVSALKAFSLLAGNSDNPILSRKINQICDDLQAGVSISGAMGRHLDIFSDFYINMVKVGEETGKLNQTFARLADYLDRQYVLTSKTRSALIYPAFVVFTFFVVMILMFVVVIPKLSVIILDSGQAVPFFTTVIIFISDFFVHFGLLVLIFLTLLALWLWSLARTESGQNYVDRKRISIPFIGKLYKQLYLSRMADNMETMLIAGIPILRTLDITADVVGNRIYRNILKDVADGVKSGMALSAAFEKHKAEIPGIMVEMIKVGEETGFLGNILKTLSDFYQRETNNAVDTLVGLIEPVMIVALGLAVGILLVSVLLPIYNLAGSIS